MTLATCRILKTGVEDASRLDLEKEVFMCFDFRRARSHPPGPTLTGRLTG